MPEFRWDYREKSSWYSIRGTLNLGYRRWQCFVDDEFIGHIEAEGNALMVDGYNGRRVRIGVFSDLDEAKAALEAWAMRRQATEGGEADAVA